MVRESRVLIIECGIKALDCDTEVGLIICDVWQRQKRIYRASFMLLSSRGRTDVCEVRLR